ncbi:Acetyl esterase [Streptomyces sp. enrichment culture]|uniref:alpha/beta hydrolase n=1 Tax=Streptomyces sp. enrichment culture TaxID=1795815 RepID=UPI003F556069
MALHEEMRAFLDSAPEGEVDFHDFTVAEVRTAVDGWMEVAGEGPEVAEVKDVSVPGPDGGAPAIRARLYHPRPETALPLLVFMVGGGFVANSLEVEDTPVRRIAGTADVAVLAVECRSAPEHPYPLPNDDAATALTWALEHAAELGADPARVGVGGHSSGGALAVGAALRVARTHPGRLRALAVVTPSLGADFDTPSYRRYAQGYALTRTNARWFWSQYLGDRLADPPVEATPARAQHVEGLPPAVFQLAEFDVLHDEATALADRMRDAGVPVTLSRGEGLMHGFFYMDRVSEAAAAANRAFGLATGRLLHGPDGTRPRA